MLADFSSFSFAFLQKPFLQFNGPITVEDMRHPYDNNKNTFFLLGKILFYNRSGLASLDKLQ